MTGGLLCDARWAGPHGIGRFAREVLARLPRHEQLTAGPKPLSAGDPFWLAWQIASRRPRLYFSPGFNPPASCGVPFLFTIHDLIHLQVPAESSAAKRLYYRRLVRPACWRAARVLTVSEHSRREIVAWSGLDPERVVNVGNGVGPPFDPRGPSYQPHLPYVLCVGNSRPHKGLTGLLRAFRDLDPTALRLVLAGRFGPESLWEARDLGIGDRTEIVDSPSDEELAALYRGAFCVVVPSLAEGFGLPALEAMACGAPVIASRTGALPEVVGSAGILVDPLDAGAIPRAIDSLRIDPERRAGFCATGLARARQFTWDNVAAKVRAALAAASPPIEIQN